MNRSVLVEMRLEMGVTANHPVEITAAVFVVLAWTFGEGARAHQAVVDRQIRTLLRTLRRGHEFPAALGPEAMVPARDQGRAVFQRRAVCGLDHAPLRDDARLLIAAP